MQIEKIREWSLLTAVGVGGIQKIARTQNVSTLEYPDYVFTFPPNLCTEKIFYKEGVSREKNHLEYVLSPQKNH